MPNAQRAQRIAESGTSTETGNDLTGSYTLSGATSSSFTIGQQDNNTSQDVTGTNTGSDESEFTKTGNYLTGDYSLGEEGFGNTTLDQSGDVGTRSFTLLETTGRTFDRVTTGNTVAGASTVTEIGSDSYTLAKSDTYDDGNSCSLAADSSRRWRPTSNSPGAGSSSCFFSAVTWLTCTLNSDAGWAVVLLSPRTAASATFALNAAPKTRRFRGIHTLLIGCFRTRKLHLFSAPSFWGPPYPSPSLIRRESDSNFLGRQGSRVTFKR